MHLEPSCCILYLLNAFWTWWRESEPISRDATLANLSRTLSDVLILWMPKREGKHIEERFRAFERSLNLVSWSWAYSKRGSKPSLYPGAHTGSCGFCGPQNDYCNTLLKRLQNDSNTPLKTLKRFSCSFESFENDSSTALKDYNDCNTLLKTPKRFKYISEDSKTNPICHWKTPKRFQLFLKDGFNKPLKE